MEKKTKHRILGIIVMAALVIALLPLFHTNSDINPPTQVISTPPFPDQSAQASDSTNIEYKVALANQVTPIPFKNQDTDTGINQVPDDTINPSTSKAFNNIGKQDKQQPIASHTQKPAPTPTAPTTPDNDIDSDLTNNQEPPAAASNKQQDTENIFKNSLESELNADAKPVAKQAANKSKKREVAIIKFKPQAQRKKNYSPLDSNGLFKLKNSAWVIQLGNYKNKAEALKLANRLRTNGYSAFIQQASGGTTVYIGPENKEQIARNLAARLAYEMKIQGFVISYKPLAI